MHTYLFDFDGTLVDSMEIYGRTMLQILEDYNIAYPADIMKIITPLGTMGTAEYYLQLGVPLTLEQLLERMAAGMIDAYFTKIPAKEGVVETLHALKARGASLNVLTASPHITLDACLKRLGIYDLFDHVWSCDDFNTTKADPDIYIQAAGKMAVPVHDVLFLDDNLNACKTAKLAGMQVCGVYDASSADYEAEMRAATDGYLVKFQELLHFPT